MSAEFPKTPEESASSTDYSKLLDEAKSEGRVRHNFPERAPEESKVRANFPEKPKEASELKAEESKLKGSLVEETRAPEETDWAGSISKGTEVIQRDGGDRYQVIAATEVNGRVRYNLYCESRGSTITLFEDDFIKKLNTEGSPWSFA